MLVRDIETYKEITGEFRDVVKWHPWAQVTLWLCGYEAYNGHAWTMTEANDWVKAKVQENWAMLEEVNADPLHRGLIYPPLLTDWVSYVITDIIQFGWTATSSEWTEHTLLAQCPLILRPELWTACQLKGDAGVEMVKRGMRGEDGSWMDFPLDYRRQMISHYDIGYTKRWEELTGQKLCGIKFKTEPNPTILGSRPCLGSQPRIRYRALR